MTENKTKIIITRSSQFLHRARLVKILIDGKEAGAVKNGSSEEFVVAPGSHKLQCKLSWYYSPESEVNIKQDEIIYLRTKSAATFYWPLYLLLLVGIFISYGYKSSASTRPEWVLWVQLICIFPFVLYVLYYLTLGRRKYFKLDEDVNNVFAK